MAAFLKVEADGLADGLRGSLHRSRSRKRAHQTHRVQPFFAGELFKPRLALLAEVDSVQKVSAGLPQSGGAAGTEIGNGQLFFRRLYAEEITERGVRSGSELL